MISDDSSLLNKSSDCVPCSQDNVNFGKRRRIRKIHGQQYQNGRDSKKTRRDEIIVADENVIEISSESSLSSSLINISSISSIDSVTTGDNLNNARFMSKNDSIFKWLQQNSSQSWQNSKVVESPADLVWDNWPINFNNDSLINNSLQNRSDFKVNYPEERNFWNLKNVSSINFPGGRTSYNEDSPDIFYEDFHCETLRQGFEKHVRNIRRASIEEIISKMTGLDVEEKLKATNEIRHTKNLQLKPSILDDAVKNLKEHTNLNLNYDLEKTDSLQKSISQENLESFLQNELRNVEKDSLLSQYLFEIFLEEELKTVEKNDSIFELPSSLSTRQEYQSNERLPLSSKSEEFFRLHIRNVTPPPNYQLMNDDLLKQELLHVGVKKFDREQAIVLLQHLYDQQHPFIKK